MPLTVIQQEVTKALRSFRTEHDFVGGGAALNKKWSRLSDDMDIFHDRRDRLPDSVEREIQALRDAGFVVEETVESDLTVEIIAGKNNAETKVQWFYDDETCKRFFAAVQDEDFGFRLHQADTAVNKVLCASRRREAVRDAIDLLNIVRLYSPLGPLIWAAVGKAPSSSPISIARGIRNIVFGYSNEELRTVSSEDDGMTTQDELRETLGPALDGARAYCEDVAPEALSGHLFVDQNDKPIEATEEMLASGTARALPVTDFGIMPKMGE